MRPCQRCCWTSVQRPRSCTSARARIWAFPVAETSVCDTHRQMWCSSSTTMLRCETTSRTCSNSLTKTRCLALWHCGLSTSAVRLRLAMYLGSVGARPAGRGLWRCSSAERHCTAAPPSSRLAATPTLSCMRWKRATWRCGSSMEAGRSRMNLGYGCSTPVRHPGGTLEPSSGPRAIGFGLLTGTFRCHLRSPTWRTGPWSRSSATFVTWRRFEPTGVGRSTGFVLRSGRAARSAGGLRGGLPGLVARRSSSEPTPPSVHRPFVRRRGVEHTTGARVAEWVEYL